MTTQEKLVKRKLSILELAEYLKNVSQACRINGVSRQLFYATPTGYQKTDFGNLRQQQGSTKPQKGAAPNAEPLSFLVAGKGFEPMTFGL